MMAEIEVLHPGLFSSIQDFGRHGYQKFGVPISGVMDRYAYKIANLLLQNEADAAVLEMTQIGPKLRFADPATIAICGAHLSPSVNGAAIRNNEPVKIEPGSILSFGRPLQGNRAYLGISGGFQSEKVLNSRSWYEGITTYDRLEKGMKLSYFTSKEKILKTHSSVKLDQTNINFEKINVFPGPEFENLPESLKSHLRQNRFSVDKNNNRMAVQLSEVMENLLQPIITGPVFPGTVQLTPGGRLIILMRDCQTTGGYPRILQLSEKALNVLAQKKTGDEIRFLLEI